MKRTLILALAAAAGGSIGEFGVLGIHAIYRYGVGQVPDRLWYGLSGMCLTDAAMFFVVAFSSIHFSQEQR
jgi:hypothetical protein